MSIDTKRVWRAYVPMLVLWGVLIVLHFLFPATKHDDAWFAEILAGDKASFENWLAFLVSRYHEWSSRSLIEGFLILFARFPILWRVGDILVCISLSILLDRLFNPEGGIQKRIILCFSVALYPLSILYEVGYIATSLNYLWPLTAALAGLSPAIKHFWGREVRTWEYAIALPMLFLGGFQELIAATSLLALLCAFVWRLVSEHKLPRFESAGILICVAMVVWMLTCPGNDNRSVLETEKWLPAYANLTLFQKVELGFSSTAKQLFLNERNVFVFVFCAVIGFSVVFQKGTAVWKKILSCLPAAFVGGFGLLGPILAPICPPISIVRAWVGELGTGFSLLAPATWFPDTVFVAIFAILLIALRFAVPDTRLYCFLFVLLALGAISRFAMGLSPTVWISGERTFTLLYLSMSAVIAALISNRIAPPRKGEVYEPSAWFF